MADFATSRANTDQRLEEAVAQIDAPAGACNRLACIPAGIWFGETFEAIEERAKLIAKFRAALDRDMADFLFRSGGDPEGFDAAVSVYVEQFCKIHSGIPDPILNAAIRRLTFVCAGRCRRELDVLQAAIRGALRNEVL